MVWIQSSLILHYIIQTPIMEMQKESSYGPIVGLVIIILIIALGSVYFLQERDGDNGANLMTEPTAEVTEQADQAAAIQEIETQSASDELDAIEADLNGTDLNALDTSFDDLGL